MASTASAAEQQSTSARPMRARDRRVRRAVYSADAFKNYSGQHGGMRAIAGQAVAR